MIRENKVCVANTADGTPLSIFPKMGNRHGLIAGATGTGKTVTLKVLAESFSDIGVPVFLADVKGDLAGTMTAGNDTEDMQKRIERLVDGRKALIHSMALQLFLLFLRTKQFLLMYMMVLW